MNFLTYKGPLLLKSYNENVLFNLRISEAKRLYELIVLIVI